MAGNGSGTYELRITMSPSGVEIHGPVQNFALCHEMLRRARMVLEHEETKAMRRAEAAAGTPSGLVVPRFVR